MRPGAAKQSSLRRNCWRLSLPENLWVSELPKRLIGDSLSETETAEGNAFDSDSLDRDLAQYHGIEMIAPNRSHRIRRTYDGRSLRRQIRSCQVERLFAWLHNIRRLVALWDYNPENFSAFFYLGCAPILLKQSMRLLPMVELLRNYMAHHC